MNDHLPGERVPVPPDEDPSVTYALALMRSTMIADAGMTTRGAEIVCDALAPQVRRMLADADARVERARADALAEETP